MHVGGNPVLTVFAPDETVGGTSMTAPRGRTLGHHIDNTRESVIVLVLRVLSAPNGSRVAGSHRLCRNLSRPE